MSKRTIDDITDPQQDDDHPKSKVARIEQGGKVYSLSYAPPSATPQPPPPFQQPLPLLTFSYTPSRELVFDDSALKYFVEPPRGAELGYRYDRWIRRPDERGRLDGLLRAWSKIRTKGGLGEIGVVSWRGVMTKILTSPYEMRDEWELNVMRVNGTMYFEEHLSTEKLKEKNDMAPHHRLQSYYGYAFESWCTSDTLPPSQSQRQPGWGGDVDTNVQWCQVAKTKLGGVRLIVGGEVDCARGPYKGRTDNLVELKTAMSIRPGNQSDESKFEKKLLKFYFQSFLLGVPEILVGFRTPQGRLTTLQSFRTIEIPRAVRGKQGAWDPSVCLSWGERLLEFLKSNIGESFGAGESAEEEGRVWRVKFTPKEGVELRVLDRDEVEDVVGGEERTGFLPKWFVDQTRASQDEEKDKPGPDLARVVESKVPEGWVI